MRRDGMVALGTISTPNSRMVSAFAAKYVEGKILKIDDWELETWKNVNSDTRCSEILPCKQAVWMIGNIWTISEWHVQICHFTTAFNIFSFLLIK